MAKIPADQQPKVTLIIDEATVLVHDGIEHSGTVTVSQTVADELLKSDRATVVTITEEITDGTTGNA
ncbi:MAG: hypothetical protein NT103_08305 [Campylobacterales bacterium]|nr:hypothetical protein [Campylobacterales bacterium]